MTTTISFKPGDKVATDYDTNEGYFLSASDGIATILRRDYAYLGMWQDYTDDMLWRVPIEKVQLVEDGKFALKGHYFYDTNSEQRMTSDEIIDLLKNKSEKTYFVMDDHTDNIYFCGMGYHLPVFLHIMKKYWGLRGVTRSDVPKWTKVINEYLTFYNGLVHGSEHYAENLPKRFRRK